MCKVVTHRWACRCVTVSLEPCDAPEWARNGVEHLATAEEVEEYQVCEYHAKKEFEASRGKRKKNTGNPGCCFQ